MEVKDQQGKHQSQLRHGVLPAGDPSQRHAPHGAPRAQADAAIPRKRAGGGQAAVTELALRQACFWALLRVAPSEGRQRGRGRPHFPRNKWRFEVGRCFAQSHTIGHKAEPRCESNTSSHIVSCSAPPPLIDANSSGLTSQRDRNPFLFVKSLCK